jgi:hypothetical protein
MPMRMPKPAITTGKRSESRLRVRLPARLIGLDFNYSVILSDLSEFGARVELQGEPLPECDVVLTWHEYEGFGRIRWSHSGETGIGFYDPIPRNWLIATRDLDSVNRLGSNRDLDRRHAREWVMGKTRI